MVKTRAMKRMSLSRRRSYARRVKSSPCRSKGPAVCRSMKNCKYVSKKRHYCRKVKNTHRSKSGGAKRTMRRHRKAGTNPTWAVPATLFGLNELVKRRNLGPLKKLKSKIPLVKRL